MTVRVETFDDPRIWRRHPLYESIKGEIHLCATRNYLEGIEEKYSNPDKTEFAHLFTIHELINEVLYEWTNPEKLLQQYLTLKKIIHESSGEQHLKSAFRNNASEILETVRMLVICGITPESLKDIKNLREKEKFFIDIWKKIEEIDGENIHQMKRYIEHHSDRDEIIGYLNRLQQKKKHRKRKKADLISSDKQKIILHGFYFITPEQQVFLKFLERSGFELIFFQYYDERFPNTFDFIKSFISSKQGWTDDWKITKLRDFDGNSMGAHFLQSFENNTQKTRGEKKQLYSYDSFFSFLHQVIMKHYPIGKEENKARKMTERSENVQIIATNADILNEMLIQYYPERFVSRRNFLNYPVGQFILKIHEMRHNNEIYLNEDILMTSFSSGWLIDQKTGENARDYTYDLKNILPFFSDCKTIQDWLERMDELHGFYKEVLPLFEGKGDSRVVESVRSPFAKIAHFSLEKSRLEQIRIFFTLLDEMTRVLFDLSSNETSLENHFKQLAQLMTENSPAKSNAYLEIQEKEIINEIQKNIENINDTQSFLYDDIGEAIYFYLSGHFGNEEGEGFIKPFIEVDGEAFKSTNRKVYLTGLDEQGLPLGEFELPWPLQSETFEYLSTKHQSLELYILRNQTLKQMSRYLLFIALEFLWDENLQLSWMKSFLDRVELEPAVYMRYLDLERKDMSLTHDISNEEHQDTDKFDFTKLLPDEKELNSTLKRWHGDDLLVEYVSCPRRFYYGSVLNRYPVFEDEFIHQFIYSQVIKTVKMSTNFNDNEVIKMVGEAFPQWTEFKKENKARKTLSYPWKKVPRSSVEGIKISQLRTNFQFPGWRDVDRDNNYKEVISKKSSILEKIEKPENHLIIPEAKPGKYCRYCPYLDYCKDGLYPVDGGGS